MLKRLVSFLLMGLLCLPLISCKDSTSQKGDKASTQQNTATAKPEAAPKQKSAELRQFSHSISTDAQLTSLRAKERTSIPVTVKNTGNETWPTEGQMPVSLSYHWIDSITGDVVMEGPRTFLPQDLKPGESVVLYARIIAPDRLGQYRLRLDMVQDTVAWFGDAGSKPLELPVTVN